MSLKTCEYCGKEFEVVFSRFDERRFCSRKCYGGWMSENLCGENHPRYRTKFKKTCAQCGKTFEVIPSKKNQLLCSRECAAIWRSKTMCGENSPSWGKVEKICERCGKKYKVIASCVSTSRFCSNKCYGEWRSENMCGENNIRYKGKAIKICEYCGVAYEIYPSAQTNARFCSNKCRNKWRSENIYGENHPSWRGGLSFEPYCSKFNERFKEYIREKFGRICFLCPTTEEENGKKLSVHHVSYDKDCLCDESDCEFVPLCIRCHAKTNHARDYWENLIMDKLKEKNMSQ